MTDKITKNPYDMTTKEEMLDLLPKEAQHLNPKSCSIYYCPASSIYALENHLITKKVIEDDLRNNPQVRKKMGITFLD